ncbi:helix-turn-helix domain-containing protein [Nonomuraea sp. NPDC050643]|uniref:helix-turn-helix domain-containing protein n=1 Tax=Nonomuraea sp. NPDC050643 TaxID=3155660 RepID=UPI0033EFB64A
MRGVGPHVIEQSIDTDTMDGLASARARGRVGGRRPRLTSEQAASAQELYDARVKTVQQIADLFGVPRSTVYGHLKGDTPTEGGPGGGRGRDAGLGVVCRDWPTGPE